MVSFILHDNCSRGLGSDPTTDVECNRTRLDFLEERHCLRMCQVMTHVTIHSQQLVSYTRQPTFSMILEATSLYKRSFTVPHTCSEPTILRCLSAGQNAFHKDAQCSTRGIAPPYDCEPQSLVPLALLEYNCME